MRRPNKPRAGRPALLLLLVFGLTKAATAQTATPPEVTVAVETNLPEAVLYADSLRLGPVGDGVFRVPATTQALRLVPEADAWSVEPLSRPLRTSEEGDTLRLQMRFPYHYAVESVPFGADVYLEGERDVREKLGLTPLVYRSESPLAGTLVVERQGYRSAEIAPGTDVWNRDVLILQPLVQTDVATAEMDWNPPAARRRWIDVAAIGLAAAGGATAIYYKFKANDRYDVYAETGDPALRPEIRRYDRYSTVGLGAMQVGLGVFALRLVLR